MPGEGGGGLLLARLITQIFWVQDPSRAWVVATAQFTFPDVHVKGSSTECPQRQGSGMGIALPLQKENNEWHSVSRASYLKSTSGSLDEVQGAMQDQDYYLCFSLIPRRGQSPSPSDCVSGKGSWHAHSSHYSFPVLPNTTHIGSRWVVQINTEGKVVEVVRGGSPGSREEEG